MTSSRLAATAGLALAMAGMGPMPHGIGSGFASPRGLGKRGRNGSRFMFASGVRELARLRRRKCRSEYDAMIRKDGETDAAAFWRDVSSHTNPGDLRFWIDGVRQSDAGPVDPNGAGETR